MVIFEIPSLTNDSKDGINNDIKYVSFKFIYLFITLFFSKEIKMT